MNMLQPLRNFQIPSKFQCTFKELSYMPSSCRHVLLEVLLPNHPTLNDHSLGKILQSMYRILTEVQIKKLTEFWSLKSFNSTYQKRSLAYLHFMETIYMKHEGFICDAFKITSTNNITSVSYVLITSNISKDPLPDFEFQFPVKHHASRQCPLAV